MTLLPLRSEADAEACAQVVAAHLAAGGILGYPTETVYGLGTALRADALARLAKLKGREGRKPFLLLAAEPRRLPGLTWTPAAVVLARLFWPGPLTLAVPADGRYPPPVRAPGGAVAVRDTPHPPLRRLLQLIGQPITSTSANPAGDPPAGTAAELQRTLLQLPAGAEVLVLDGGALPASAPSSVVDCTGERPRLVRDGALPLAMLRSALREQGFEIDVG